MEESINKLEGAIEAILFSMGEAVPIKELAKALEVDEPTLEKVLNNMMDKYEAEDNGSDQYLTEEDGKSEILNAVVNKKNSLQVFMFPQIRNASNMI